MAGLPAPRPRTIDSELGPLVFWGSECLCGNATYGSMRCDSCQETTGTTALWMEPRPGPVEQTLVVTKVITDPGLVTASERVPTTYVPPREGGGW